jgi:hypothetical protein
VIDKISSCENSSFNLNVFFLYFLLLDGSDKRMRASINQLVNGENLTTEEG